MPVSETVETVPLPLYKVKENPRGRPRTYQPSYLFRHQEHPPRAPTMISRGHLQLDYKATQPEQTPQTQVVRIHETNLHPWQQEN
jgi:hypothetical protein